jgi:predicted transcriptional regulator
LILAYIVANPGVYLRELADDLDFAMGVVQYHLWALTRDGEVEDCRTGRFRHFFDAGKFQELERKVISLLRQGTPGRILALLANGDNLTHTNLARVLGISSQALSWQISRLRTMGVVQTSGFQYGGSFAYVLPNPVLELVRQYLRQGKA